MKTKDELNALKKEIETMNMKLAELNEDELQQVIGGLDYNLPKKNPDERYVMKATAPSNLGIEFDMPEGNPNQYDIHIYKNTTDFDRPF